MTSSKRTSIRESLNISRVAIQHSWLTICCWMAIAVAGLFAFSSLEYALFPDITFPVVVVSTTAPAATALESEAQLTVPLEAKLQQIEGLNTLASATYAGRTVINLRFQVGKSLADSAAAVKGAIAQTDLPSSASYEVIPLNLNEATAVSYALTSDTLTLQQLSDLAKSKVLPPLRDISSVLRVDLLGTGTAAAPSGSSAAPEAASSLQNSPTLVRFDQKTALALQVVKRKDANTLDVADAVAQAVQRLQADLPNAQLTLATTQADYIRAATQATIDSLWGAVVIAVLVIFVFLRSWQATLITALAIPLSLLGTYIVMAIYGFNLETITLLGLALVIGIIVDDAIVEVENITRYLDLGVSPRQAAIIATQEIGLTVTASTLTIVAVFLPVAFMGGTVGQFFKPFGLTVSAAVLTSLLVARTLTPVLCVYWLKPKANASTDLATASNLPESAAADLTHETVPTSKMERVYSRMLRWSLRHRWKVVGIAIASFIAGIAIIPLIPQGFVPQLDRGEFYLNYTVALPEVSAPSQLSQSSASLPTALSADPRAANSQATDFGAIDPRSLILQETLEKGKTLEGSVFQLPEVALVLTEAGGKGRPNQGRLYIKLKENRDRDTAAVQAQLRENLLKLNSPELADVTTSVEDVQFIDTGGEKPLQVTLIGENLAALSQAAVSVKTKAEKLPGLVDVSTSGEDNTADKTVEINREDGQRVAYINANLLPSKALGEATSEVIAIAQSVIPAGIHTDVGGDAERSGDVISSFGKTLVLALICMLAVVFIPFGRLLEPMVVGLSLPLSIVGAMLALLITRSDFGVISLLGLLFLLGLLDKNALLLLDYASQLRRAGMQRTDALLKTGLVRLRPIIMTTASTVLGMMPLALGLGAGAELRQPMAVVIIGGLITSTLLSLIVVPVLYSLLDDGWLLFSKRFRKEQHAAE